MKMPTEPRRLPWAGFFPGSAEFVLGACNVGIHWKGDEALRRNLCHIKRPVVLDVELPGKGSVTIAEDNNVTAAHVDIWALQCRNIDGPCGAAAVAFTAMP